MARLSMNVLRAIGLPVGPAEWKTKVWLALSLLLHSYQSEGMAMVASNTVARRRASSPTPRTDAGYKCAGSTAQPLDDCAIADSSLCRSLAMGSNQGRYQIQSSLSLASCFSTYLL